MFLTTKGFSLKVLLVAANLMKKGSEIPANGSLELEAVLARRLVGYNLRPSWLWRWALMTEC